MRIETVKEKWDDEKPDPVKLLIDEGRAERFLSLRLRSDPFIEDILGIEPDLDLLAEYVSESYCKDNETSASKHKELQDALRKAMPEIYGNISEPSWSLCIPSYHKKGINWDAIEKLLPMSVVEDFSIKSLINCRTPDDLVRALRFVELYIRSGMDMLCILPPLEEEDPDLSHRELFWKFVLTRMIIETPGRFRQDIEILSSTEDLADVCISLLNKRYRRNVKAVSRPKRIG